MDKAKKKRTAERTGFTKALNAFNETHTAHGPRDTATVVAFKMLEERMEALTKCSDEMMELMFEDEAVTEAAINKEYEEARGYREKFITAKVAFETAVAAIAPESRTSSVDNGQAGNSATTVVRERKTRKYPTLELVKYSGNVREWLPFWSQFKKIHEDAEIEPEDKFQYLLQSMTPGSRAAELVKSYPPTAENYAKVISSLKARFGRDDIQIEVYVRELLQLVLQNAIAPAKDFVLSTLYDNLESHLRALESLGVTTDKCAAMLFPLVESSLPEELLRVWQRSSGQPTATSNDSADAQSKNRLTQLIQFLANEVENELRISMAVSGFKLKPQNNSANGERNKAEKVRNNKDVPSATGLLTTKGRAKSCIFCNTSEHDSANCEQAKKLDFSERQETAQKKNACYKCLNVGHSYKKCRVHLKCPWCSRKHVIIMCPDMPANKQDKSPAKSVCSFATNRDPEVFLQTLRVTLYNGDERMDVRLIIDTGSQKSYITKEAAGRMKYVPIAEQLLRHSLFGGQTSRTMNHKKYLVEIGSLSSDFRCNFTALDERVICEDVPSIKFGLWCKEIRDLDISLTDIDAGDEAVSVLVGADVAGKLLTGKRHVLQCGLVAIETYLGWTVMGAMNDSDARNDPVQITRTMFASSQVVDSLWSLDVLGIKDPIEQQLQSDREKQVKQTFLASVSVNKEGRYEVPLPWLENHPPLSENKMMAIKRLESTKKQLHADGRYEAYDAVFDEWLAEGIIERVPEAEIDNKGHYLPHRPIIKENSTTVIRPIFDASAAPKPKDEKMKSPSLNDCLEKGPNLIELISAILLRFREGKIGVVSDIKKAFLQISLNASDRDFLRFLWQDKQGNQVVFRHCRVVFGVTSSPFILSAVLFMHLEKILASLDASSEPNFSKNNIVKLMNSFYVDNCVTSVNCVSELHDFIHDAKASMELGKFDLRGWEFSHDDSDEKPTGVLGILWNKCDDTLSLNTDFADKLEFEKVTKRSILSAAHRVYDPLGFVSPAVLCPRLLLQEAWAQKLSWDQEVDDEIKLQFIKWADNLKELGKVKVPRCFLGEIKESDNVSLHTFVDASQAAYAAVIFLRVESDAGVKVHFVQAKTRVAPARKKGTDARASIPRLELLAATIGARLTQAVLESFTMKITNLYFWSDSTTVLTWIHRESNWATFVWNRVKEIRSLSNPDQWRHVPGQMNPADLPSRGCTVDQLLISRWWEGPQWLSLGSENWPVNNSEYDEQEVNKELKKSAQKVSTLLSIEKDSWVEKFSSYKKIKRILAWIYRFLYNVKRPKESRARGQLSCSELEKAENSLLKSIQAEAFNASAENERIKNLQPFKDDNDLLRLKTKILFREDTLDFRCPILLPGNNRLVNALIHEKHVELNHAGVEILMNTLREKFWIIGGRKIIRSVISKCGACRRHDAKALSCEAAPLPLNRVRDAAIFEIVGVDFAGPVYLKGGQKAWICLFTCAVYRAVHLELVTSLSTASFLMALRRHIARRGRPSIIYSDNGTNFVGLNNMFNKLNFQQLASDAATKQIEWKFNPPSAAWWGGFWERLIGILKRLLRRTLKKSCLNYEEMATVLVDCEAIINSRPITFMSDSALEVVPLTPSMFLQEIKEVGVVDLDNIEQCRFDKRYVYRQKVKEDLRRRFRVEYLGALVHKNRRENTDLCVNVNDIVLVQSDNVKRLDWPLARVIELITGKDGKVRVVRLRTADGELVRPIQRICPLETKFSTIELDTQEDELIVNKFRDLNDINVNRDESSELDTNEVCENAEQQCVTTRSGRKIVKPDRLQYK